MQNLINKLLVFVVLVLSTSYSTSIYAHSNSHTKLTVTRVSDTNYEVKIKVELVDLMQVIDLDKNADGNILITEIRDTSKKVIEYMLSHVQFFSDETECKYENVENRLFIHAHAEETVITVRPNIACNVGSEIEKINFTLFNEVDQGHRALLKLNKFTNNKSRVLLNGMNILAM